MKEKDQAKNTVEGWGASEIHGPRSSPPESFSSRNLWDFEKAPRSGCWPERGSDWIGERGCVIRSSPGGIAGMRTSEPISPLPLSPLPKQRRHCLPGFESQHCLQGRWNNSSVPPRPCPSNRGGIALTTLIWFLCKWWVLDSHYWPCWPWPFGMAEKPGEDVPWERSRWGNVHSWSSQRMEVPSGRAGGTDLWGE